MQVNTATFHSSVHLDEGRLELPDTRCPLCSSTNRQPEYTLQESPRVTLLKCLDCHAISASRMPSDQALQEYYGGYYDSAETQAGDDQVTFDNPLRLARNIVDVYCSYPFEKRVSILDFGGGDGTISCCVAKLMLEKGVERVDIVVVDYNQKTVEVQDSRIQVDRKDSLDQVHQDQDLVIASAVIEHYPHPQTLMQDLLRCMKQGSMFYARTPTMFPIIKLLDRVGVKADFTFPAHIHDLGQAFWESYFQGRPSDEFQLLASRPSIVESTLRQHFIRTVLAYSLKAPWYVFGRSYKYVGGWEVFVRRQ